MVLDQQVPIEWAFSAPLTLRERLGARWSVAGIAEMDEADLVGCFVAKPALHRYPAVMARRVHTLCGALVENYDGDIERLWDVEQAGELYERLRALPGFGTEKSKIFIALLAKKFAIRPAGWQRVCQPFGDDEPRTAADIDSPDSLAAVRAWKKAQRLAGRAKSD